jgi:hypothetical protein
MRRIDSLNTHRYQTDYTMYLFPQYISVSNRSWDIPIPSIHTDIKHYAMYVFAQYIPTSHTQIPNNIAHSRTCIKLHRHKILDGKGEQNRPLAKNNIKRVLNREWKCCGNGHKSVFHKKQMTWPVQKLSSSHERPCSTEITVPNWRVCAPSCNTIRDTPLTT